jgi:hypothetical protein
MDADDPVTFMADDHRRSITACSLGSTTARLATAFLSTESWTTPVNARKEASRSLGKGGTRRLSLGRRVRLREKRCKGAYRALWRIIDALQPATPANGPLWCGGCSTARAIRLHGRRRRLHAAFLDAGGPRVTQREVRSPCRLKQTCVTGSRHPR